MGRIDLALRFRCGEEFLMVFQVNEVVPSEYLAEENKREHCCKRQRLNEFEADFSSGLSRQ